MKKPETINYKEILYRYLGNDLTYIEKEFPEHTFVFNASTLEQGLICLTYTVTLQDYKKEIINIVKFNQDIVNLIEKDMAGNICEFDFGSILIRYTGTINIDLLKEINNIFIKSSIGCNSKLSIAVHYGQFTISNWGGRDRFNLRLFGNSINFVKSLASHGIENNINYLITKRASVELKIPIIENQITEIVLGGEIFKAYFLI